MSGAAHLPRPTEHCSVKDCRGLHKEEEGYRWLGNPLDKATVLRWYPDRCLVDLTSKPEAERARIVKEHAAEFARHQGHKTFHPAAAAHFAGFYADEQSDGSGDQQWVYVGDYVKINVGEDNPKGWSLALVEELYQTPDSQRMMRVHWLYASHDKDTALIYAKKKAKRKTAKQQKAAEEEGEEGAAEELAWMAGDTSYHKAVEGFDERQVFRARDNNTYLHEYNIAALECKVRVVQVLPGEEPPEDCECWWTLEFDRRFLTFEVPAEVAAEQQRKFLASRVKDVPLVLRGMDLYVGAGGLGYLDSMSLLPPQHDGDPPQPDPNGVQTRTDWACDYEADMAETFKANNSHSHVFTSGTDELLEVFKAFYELYHELEMDAPGQPVLPWDGQAPYQRCDDDRMIAWPRCVQDEVLGRVKLQKKAGRQASKADETAVNKAKTAAKQAAGKPSAKKRKLGDGSAAAAAAGLLVNMEEAEEETEAGAGSDLESSDAEEQEGSLAGSDEDGSDTEVEVQVEVEVEEEEEAGPSTTGKRKAPMGKGKRTAAGEGEAAPKDHAKVVISAKDCMPYHGKVGRCSEIKQMRLGECAPRVPGKGVAAGLLKNFIQTNERWLEFKVVMAVDGGGQQEVWLSRKQLKGQEALLRGFVQQLREHQCIPFPGEVDFICGGPPCQGISGNNRHAMTEDILSDPRNRQLQVFVAYIDWFKPKFVLMENVQDILKKEDGMYIKFAMGSMLNMRYQVRVGLVAAGNFGVPQGRWRCFMWAAAPGQQLPAIPKPTHNCIKFNCPVAATAKRLTSGFCNAQEVADGHMPVLLGDILSDLPPVDNFELHERQSYLSGPQRVTQAWLRRDPRPWMTPHGERMRAHDDFMLADHNDSVADLLRVAQDSGLTTLARQALLNSNHPLRPQTLKGGQAKKRSTDDMDAGQHAFETLSAALRSAPDEKLQVALWLQAEASRAGYAHTQAQMYVTRLRQYMAEYQQRRDSPDYLLTDHRAYFCNADDHYRLATVPTRKAGDDDRNFRHLEGIAPNTDGTCCYGHSHAPRKNGVSVCTGGGVHDAVVRTKKGTHKEYRVDQHNKEGWRGGALEGCQAYTVFMPTGGPLVPQWCVTFKNGKSDGRGGCFGRVAEHEIIATVVGRAEPHNLKVGHPSQKRTLTIREDARAQGFPDYHVLLAKPSKSKKDRSLLQRYQQMGNAVSPQVASALGRCLALAALHQSPPGEMLLSVPDPEYDALVEEWGERYAAEEVRAGAEARGCDMNRGFYALDYNGANLELLDNIVQFLDVPDGSSGQPSGSGSGKAVPVSEEEEEGEEEEVPQQKTKPRAKQQPRRQQVRPRGGKKALQAAAAAAAAALEEEDDESEEPQQQQGLATTSGSDKDDVGEGSAAAEEAEEEQASGGAAAAAAADSGMGEDKTEESEEGEWADAEEEVRDGNEEAAPAEAGAAEDKEEEEDEEGGEEGSGDSEELEGDETEADEADLAAAPTSVLAAARRGKKVARMSLG